MNWEPEALYERIRPFKLDQPRDALAFTATMEENEVGFMCLLRGLKISLSPTMCAEQGP